MTHRTPTALAPRRWRAVAVLLLSMLAAAVLAAPALGVTAPAGAPGTPGNDVLTGTADADNIDGRGGDDLINGLAGRDGLHGGFGDDELRGGPGRDHLLGSGVAGSGASARDNADEGRDTLEGGPGVDHMLGGLGPDRLRGGDGPDELHDGAAEYGHDRSRDTLDGGAGDDVLVSTDHAAARDVITCGAGFDRAYHDPGDRLSKDCERTTLS